MSRPQGARKGAVQEPPEQWEWEEYADRLEARIDALEKEAAWEVTIIYHYRGDIREICETAKDAAVFISKQKEPESEFYTEVWPVKFY